MVKFIKNLAISLGISILIGILALLVVTLLSDKGVISPQTNDWIVSGFSAVLFLLLGFIFGHKQKSKGFWWGLFLAAIYVGIALIVRLATATMTPLGGSMIALRSVLLLIGTILGVNRGQKTRTA